MTHELKILPRWFEDVCTQRKTFEIRKNDRDYNVGDTLILKEWCGGKYTGREVKRTVSYIYYGDGCYGLSDEYVVMAIRGARVVLDDDLCKMNSDPIDIDKAVEHYEGTLEMMKGIDLEDKA